MTILNVQPETAGQSGLLPRFIYIDTNNTLAEVATIGFLNDLASQGYSFSDNQMALVSSRPTPNSRTVDVRLYTISYSGGNYLLTLYGSSGGNWDPDANWTTTGNWDNSGEWAFTNKFSVIDTSSQALVISNLNMIPPTPTPGEMQLISESTMTLYSKTGIGYFNNEGEGIRIESILNPAAKIELYTSDHVLISASGSAPNGYIETTGNELRINNQNTVITSIETNFSSGQVKITGLPTPAPMGSVAVGWDPVTERLYQAGAVTGFVPSTSYETGSPDGPITGDWEHTGEFNVHSGTGNVEIQSQSGNVLILAELTTGLASLNGASANLQASALDMNIHADAGNINVNCNLGHLNMFGDTATLSCQTAMNIYTSAGGIQMNTNNGNFNVFAGSGPSPGQMNLGVTDAIGINSNDNQINISANHATTGGVSLSSAGGGWSVTPAGIGGGTPAMSGLSIDAVTGNVGFGAQTGTFLLGALANTVDIMSGTNMTLTAGVGLDLACANVTMSLIVDQASSPGVPSFMLPTGFKYLIINDSTNRVYKMG